MTDTYGKYSMHRVPFGTHQISAKLVGFETAIKILEVRGQEVITLNFILQEKTQLLETVTISGQSEKEKKENLAEAIDVIETKEVKLQSADLGEVMTQAEGISMQRAGGLGSNTRFALNGLSDDQVRFFYDDIPLNFTPYAFGIANIPINAINRIEIHKGVVNIQFGADALGGAVNLVTPTIYEGLSGSLAYQYGSFNTYRVTTHLSYANDNSRYFINTGGFFDNTNNNYKIDVAIPNELGTLQPQTVKRFHDGYRALGGYLKKGIRQKPWANVFSLEGYLGDYRNEIQNSQVPELIDLSQLGLNEVVDGNPFGEVLFTSQSQGLNLHYQVDLGGPKSSKWETKQIEQGWAIDLKAGYNSTERMSIDTSRNLYNWSGEIERIQIQAGEFEEDDHLITTSQSYFIRQQLNYRFSKRHHVKLALAPTYSYRTGDDLLVDGEFDPALDDGYLFDFVIGIEYRGIFLNERLQTIVFTKNYIQNIRIESLDPSLREMIVDQCSVNNNGVGGGLRYARSPSFSTKLSYKFAYRLPRQDEIFGDGQLKRENLDLRPESSHNVNFQWGCIGKLNTKTDWQVNASFFIRSINDLIFLVVNQDDFGFYQNVWSASSQGVELSGKIENPIKGLTLQANCTCQAYFNTSNEEPFASFKGDRIPNTPYSFANGGWEYELEGLMKKQDLLSIFWNGRYVRTYFVGWESVGLKQFKAVVSNQTTHNSGLTYYIKTLGIQHALTLDMQNLTNAKVFDLLYGVQRPGRACYIKLTTQF